MIIGMTGGIGCGKNTAAKLFEDLGFYTIDADLISRQVMAKGGSAYDGVIKAFGADILLDKGEIDRKKLGDIIFNSSDKRLLLESIVHPAIFAEEKRLQGVIKGKDDKSIIITHAALMVESGSYKKYDILIVVYCRKDEQIRRVCLRDNICEDEAVKRIDSQMEMYEKVRRANVIIDNSSDFENLKGEVERVSEMIKQLQYGIYHK